MFNTIQLFGFILLGGLVAGEISRHLIRLPRTTGYVLFGMGFGQSGLSWITALHIESAQLFIDLALGLILFELGHLLPRTRGEETRNRLAAGLLIAATASLLVTLCLLACGFPPAQALFASALCLATSPAITIATCSDVGAKGSRTGLLYTIVAINGAIAFSIVVLSTPFLGEQASALHLPQLINAIGSIFGSLILGGACAGLALLGAENLEGQIEHQHLLILGIIILGVGTSIYLEVSALLPMLTFGILVRLIDRDNKIIAVRIASDARVFLVITFVLAGAALDIGLLFTYWPQAALLALIRAAALGLPIWLNKKQLALNSQEAIFMGIGLQPMSSVALILLANTQALNVEITPEMSGTLMASILLMQLIGPLATQTAILGFGEATRLRPPLSAPLLHQDKEG